ncbi:unnamed protein product, partial [Phaeothamnion confervicola]
MMRQHGLPFFVLWTVVWAAGYPILYLVIDQNPTAVLDGLRALRVDAVVNLDALDPRIGSFALAVVINEAVEPLRFPLCLAGAPAFKRAMQR